MRARIAAVLLLVVALGGCTAPPVLEREEIPAEVTCRQFGHVLTVLSNARISHTEGRSSAQELAGASQLAIDLVNEIVAEPGTDIADAIAGLQKQSLAEVLASYENSDGNGWSDNQQLLNDACTAEGYPLGAMVWTGG